MVVGQVKRVRDAQRLLLGGGRKDLVDFAVSLRVAWTTCRSVDEVAAGLSRVDRQVDGTVTNTAIVRYDAYEDTGGRSRPPSRCSTRRAQGSS